MPQINADWEKQAADSTARGGDSHRFHRLSQIGKSKQRTPRLGEGTATDSTDYHRLGKASSGLHGSGRDSHRFHRLTQIGNKQAADSTARGEIATDSTDYHRLGKAIDGFNRSGTRQPQIAQIIADWERQNGESQFISQICDNL